MIEKEYIDNINTDEADVRLIASAENKRAYEFIKRIGDIVFSSVGLIILLPFFLIISAAIRLEDGGKAFFLQERVGRNGKIFKMYKFRSMCVDAEERFEEVAHLNEADGPAFKIENDPRITKVGRIIRRLSIDELPQLINCIKGDMSIVGPRPPLEREVEKYNAYQRQRLLVKPGITCYWQSCGRSNTSFDEWMDMDMKYIRERGVFTDIKILLMTVPAVLMRRGAC